MRFSLDSNLLVYATDGRDPTRQTAAITIVAQAARSDCVLTLQSLAEFFHAVTRKGIIPRPEATSQVRRWMAIFVLAPGTTPAGLSAAMEAAVSGRFQFYDALLLATAREAGSGLPRSDFGGYGGRPVPNWTACESCPHSITRAASRPKRCGCSVPGSA